MAGKGFYFGSRPFFPFSMPIFITPHSHLSLTALTPHLLRVRYAPDGQFAPRRSWAVTEPDEAFAPMPAHLHPAGLSTDFVQAQVDSAGALTITEASGQVVCADAAPPQVAGGLVLRKRIHPEDRFYGCGQRGNALEKTGARMVNWTTDPPVTPHGPHSDPMYVAIPVLLVVRPTLSYAVYVNNTYRSEWSIHRDLPHEWVWRAAQGELDYYLAVGATPARALEEITRVLGRMPMPPLWALGYHQSRWSYPTAEAVRAVASDLRQHRLPADAIHLDIDYMDGYRVFTWNRQAFPDPAGLLADLRAQHHLRAVTIIDPGVKVDDHYPIYREGVDNGHFITQANGDLATGYVWPDLSAFADFTRPATRQWWGDKQAALLATGASGIWNDMNEPVTFDRPFSQGGGGAGTLPLDAPQGDPAERTTHAEAHNLFGLLMCRASYEGWLAHSAERPFILTRSAFAGIQRYAANWMGDNTSIWEHLRLSLPQLLNMGLSGVPFVGVDIGGFGDNATPELFARWMQIGALMPFCRGHSAAWTAPHEPWAFGPRTLAITREYLNLRYRLLPYLYSLFWQAHQTGQPLWRAMFYHFPADARTYHLDSQVMLGEWLLAAPVLEAGRAARVVYLPAGVWHDWWTGETLHGPAEVLASAPLERLPLYVRAGAILPTGPSQQFTGEKPLDPLTVHVYPGAEGAFTLYEDDGQTLAYQHGAFRLTHFRWHNQTLHMQVRAQGYTPAPRQLQVVIHAATPLTAQAYPAGAYDLAARTLTLTQPDPLTEAEWPFDF